MLYLLAVLAPPSALLVVGKYVQAAISLVLLIAAFLVGLLFVVPGVMLALVAIVHAIVVIHGVRADEHVERVVAALERNEVERNEKVS